MTWEIDGGPAAKIAPRRYKTLAGMVRYGVAAFLRADPDSEVLRLDVTEQGGWAAFQVVIDTRRRAVLFLLGKYTFTQDQTFKGEWKGIEHGNAA